MCLRVHWVICDSDMRFTTSSGTEYGYDLQSNRITIIEDNEFNSEDIAIFFMDSERVSTLPSIDTFVLEITQQCNMRCTYCCYSGNYRNTRKHNNHSMSDDNIEVIIDFILRTKNGSISNICFYGGEPLLRLSTISKFIDCAKVKFDGCVEFSLNTNGTLLERKVVDYLIENNISVFISLDGGKDMHDNKRKLSSGADSFKLIYNNLSYIKAHYPTFFAEKVSILITVENVGDIIEIAKQWTTYDLLKDKLPLQISAVAPNYAAGVERLDEQIVIAKYYKLLEAYILDPENPILKRFFDDYVFDLKSRDISDLSSSCSVPACLPNNRKCFIGADGKIGVCEKMCDKYRIGNIEDGFDFVEINNMIDKMSAIRKKHCSLCPVVRLCDSCLLILDLNEEELSMHCHNQRIYIKTALTMLCELAENELI